MVAGGAFTGWVRLGIDFNTRLMPLCRIFLHPSDLSFKLLGESTSYFGYNPRQCFEASSSIATLEDKIQEVASAIRRAAGNTSYNIMQLLNEAQTGGSDVSHTIFQIFPSNTDTNRLLSHCHFETVSRWALDLLLCQYEVEQANAAADFFRKISGMRGAASLRGYLFERAGIEVLG
jgi:hypothetical protein